jgi:hypothetical protein
MKKNALLQGEILHVPSILQKPERRFLKKFKQVKRAI